jgi:uncharacterized membrane protein YciS (DUF1049 family)
LPSFLIFLFFIFIIFLFVSVSCGCNNKKKFHHLLKHKRFQTVFFSVYVCVLLALCLLVCDTIWCVCVCVCGQNVVETCVCHSPKGDLHITSIFGETY